MSVDSTTQGDTSAPQAAMRRSRSLPLLRTWDSTRFRVLVALLLVVVGAIAIGVYAAVLVDVQPESWGYDVTVYYQASQRIMTTGTPYLSSQLAGPIDALCPDCYLYPPPFAQAFAPLTALSTDVVRALWFAVQALAMLAALWLGTGLGGAKRTLERAAWCLVASILYVPVFASLWFGNVSTLLALCVTLVAMGEIAAGVGAAVGSLLKVAPATLVPGTLFIDGRARRSLVVSMAVIAGLSFLAAPGAWLQYPTVLANMIRGSADDSLNLAPAYVAAQMGAAPWVADVVRVATIIVALSCVATSVWAARRPRGAPLTALLATVAMLLLAGSLWYHYLAVLLPFAAMAWPASSSWLRAGLLVAAVLVSVGPGAPLVVLSGALLLAVVAGRALWSEPRAAVSESNA